MLEARFPQIWTFSPEEFFEQAIAEQPFSWNRIGAGRQFPVYIAADFSYRSERLTGDRWMLAGDAAGFIDPVFSSGVFLAVLAGEQAPMFYTKCSIIPKRAAAGSGLRKDVNRAMDVYLRFVESWYSEGIHRSFPTIRRAFPDSARGQRGAGRQRWHRFAIQWRMAIFYLLVRLQKYTFRSRRSAPCCRKKNSRPLSPLSSRVLCDHLSLTFSFFA